MDHPAAEPAFPPLHHDPGKLAGLLDSGEDHDNASVGRHGLTTVRIAAGRPRVAVFNHTIPLDLCSNLELHVVPRESVSNHRGNLVSVVVEVPASNTAKTATYRQSDLTTHAVRVPNKVFGPCGSNAGPAQPEDRWTWVVPALPSSPTSGIMVHP
ncbi:uncharacterized protein LY79DRAFT_582300 [Colletotrichum navitas]|uniref:Uncharacterized protein n=1 Tax=Colletotrichum navitas TaxID=681940 RepID=A0AAD8PSA5_9PEZI|nr:uncharacterized protein LY79DRAFT_582300 [Colletotrichum navitas]KAK1579760.1 hypothetical protein LY79DRAFT_582300 [Colletotrichum navitas]